MGKGMGIFIDQMRSLYDEWDIRVMVLVSLYLQVLLQLLGNHRKFSSSMWVRIIVWCSYISSDSIVIMALGIMSSKLGRIHNLDNLELKTRLHAFWAPCLLILLGGPDTINAYSVEDNQLWLRHFVVLVVQTSATGYICFLTWTSDYLSYLSLLMMVAAVIKYGERVWVLWKVSFDNLRSLPYASRVQVEEVEEEVEELNKYSELTRGYALFQIFKRIFLSQQLSLSHGVLSKEVFKELTSQSTFKIIEIELGFMYDLLHTKAVTMYTPWGLCRRLITSAISCVVIAVFSYYYWLHVEEEKKMSGRIMDVAVTFVLLATIISLEIYYWVFLIFSSDWADVLWFTKGSSSSSSCSEFWNKNNNVVTNSLIKICKQPRWSNSVGQLSFFSLVGNIDKRPLYRLRNFVLDSYYYAQHREITDYIKDQIFLTITVGPHDRESFTNLENLLQEELSDEFKHRDYSPPLFIMDNMNSQFDDSILVWHIVTELCYCYDEEDQMPSDDIKKAREAAKLLSRYMFYLFVRHPFMLQSAYILVDLKQAYETRGRGLGLEKIRGRGGAANLTKSDVEEIIKAQCFSGELGANFRDACNVTEELTREEHKSNAWRLILRSWLAHLYYAAYNCREDYHVQQLRRGGELLTHVSMLMSHFGLTNHFQMDLSFMPSLGELREILREGSEES